MPLDRECENCETTFHTDTKLAITAFGEWNWCPCCGARMDDETAEDVADEHMQIVEFGRAVKSLESAALGLRRNGHAYGGAIEAAESAVDDLETVFAEYESMREHGVLPDGGSRFDSLCETESDDAS